MSICSCRFNFRRLLLVQLFSILTLVAFAQNKSLSGVVLDATGEAVIGANVVVKGTTNGTITNFDGQFTLNVPDNCELEVSYIGYTPQTVKYTGQSTIKVVLNEDTQALEEVVVVGYGTMRKSDLTGSVGKVDLKEMTKVSTIDAAQALQGRLAGVNVVSNSGSPGAGATIRIRGIGTINNSDPLYIVDGFPCSDMSHVSPQDIESMEVLKDASATAIYGSRGANGVILVKTKGGKKGSKTEITANAYFGISNMARTLDLADATQYANAYRQLNGNLSDAAFANDNPLIQHVLDSQQNGVYLKGTNWQDEVTRQAFTQRYNVSAQGAGEHYSFNHGVTFSDEQGIMKGSELKKFMFHTNNNYDLNKRTKIGLNVNYVWYEKPGEQETDFYSGVLPGALRSDPISAAWDSYTDFYGQVYFSPSQTNPALSIWQNKYSKTTEHRFIGNFFLQIDDILTKGLSFRAQYGHTFIFNDQRQFSPSYFITATQKNDEQTLYQRRNNGNTWANTNYFSYNNNVGLLNVNATLGMELQANTWSDIWAKGYGVPEDADLLYLDAHKDTEKFELGGGKAQNRLASYFFRANLSWDNKYMLTGTVRRDGTSRFKGENRWGWFSSYSAGWNISNEDMMEDFREIMPILKLRAGYGKVGNQDSAGNFDYVSSVTGGYNYSFNGRPVSGSVQEQLANTELTWESAEQYNVGVDFGFLDNRLNGSIDAFVRKTNDMIIDSPLPMYAGKKTPKVNAGTMENKGIEVSVGWQDKVRDFSYGANFNITYIKNEVTSLAGGDPIRSGNLPLVGNTTMTCVGKEIAFYYGYKTDGIFKTQQELDNYVNSKGEPILGPGGVRPELGDVRYVNLDDDTRISDSDMTYLGSATPKFTGGLNVNVGWKNFDLTMFMNFSYGGKLINTMNQTLYSSRMFESNISSQMALNHWSESNPNGNYPRLTKTDPNKNDETFSDRMVEDGSYLKIKQIQLGYTLPKQFTKNIGISSLRVYCALDNLHTFTNYTGLDPEVFGLYGNPFYYGIDMVNYPQPRTVSFGFNLTL